MCGIKSYNKTGRNVVLTQAHNRFATRLLPCR